MADDRLCPGGAADDDFQREISGGSRDRDSDRERRPDDSGYGKPKKKKRRSMLEDFLDFGWPRRYAEAIVAA